MKTPPRWTARVPFAVVFILFLAFAVGGTSLPFACGCIEEIFRVSAAICAVAILLAFVRPFNPMMRMIAGATVIAWAGPWTFFVALEFFPERVGLFGVLQFPAIAILVAWSWGRNPIPRVQQHKPLLKRSPVHHVENTTPHHSPVTKKRSES